MISKSEKDFKDRPGQSPALALKKEAILFVLSAFFLTVAPVSGMTDESPRITGVEVWVDGLPAPPDIKGLVPVREGDIFTLKKISEAIRLIWKTGLFQDVQVLRREEEGVRLQFLLARRLRVRRIHFEGEKGLPRRKLRQSLSSFRADNLFSEEKLDRGVEELRRALEREGFFESTVEPRVQRLSVSPEVDLSFAISVGHRYIIDRIQFTGSGMISEPTLRRHMKTREGRVYVPSLLELDLERLRNAYISLGYRRVEVELEAVEFDRARERVALSLRVNPHEKIEIVIIGAKVPLGLVEPIWEEKIFEEWGLREGEARILSHLRGQGFVFARVTSSVQVEESTVRVIHRVDPGRKYKIQEVKLEGLKHFASDELKERLGLVERLLFFNFLDGKKIFALPEEIRSIYQSRGFPDVRVDLNFFEKDNKVTAIYYVHEGEQQTIGEIRIQGAHQLDEKTLRAQMDLAEGGAYFPPAIQKNVQKLEMFYLRQGIRGTKIEVSTEPMEKNSLRLVLNIQEGRRQTITNILVVGNEVTKMGTILRELEVREGDLALAESIMASKQNLENLGIFSEVRMEEVPVAPEEETLVITVREGERNYAGLGVGLETKSEPWRSALFDVALRLRGTAEFMRSNIFGRAARLSLVSQFSLAEKRAVVSWEQPYFLFDFPMDTYLNAWVEEEDRQSFGYDREGISLSGIRPVTKDMTLLLALRYARTTLTYLEVTPSEIDRQFYPYSTTSISSSIIREKRNDPFNPERGHFFSLAFEWAFPLFETESDFLKAIVKHQFFLTVAPRVNFSSTARLGLGMGRMPIHERLFAGGSNSFRGQRYDELGPRDATSARPIGGKALFLLNVEFTFPLFSTLQNLSGAIFYDTGQVFYNRSDFDLREFEHAIGLGLRYRTPLGPLRLELGWNLSEPQRRGKPLVFITIGHVF